VQWDDSVIKHGEERIVRVVVREKGAGERTVRIAIVSNDRDGRVQQVVLHYENVRDVDVHPAQLDFGRLERRDLPQEMSVVVEVNNQQLAQRMADLSCDVRSVGDVHVRTEKGETPHQWILKAWLEANAPSGEYLGKTRLFSSSCSFEMDIPLYAYVVGRVFERVSPIVLKGEDGTVHTVVVRARDGAPSVLSAVATVSKNLETLVAVDAQAGQDHTLVLHAAATGALADARLGEVLGHIRIEARLAGRDVEILRVPLRLVPST
jgi:hypothetical protein